MSSGQKESPYPEQGSGKHTQPKGGGEPERRQGDLSGKDPNTPAPQTGGPEKATGSPPSTGVGDKK